MERNLSEDNSSSESFELFEPILEPIGVQTTPTMPSIPNSMSIVTIPDEYRNSTAVQINDKHISNDLSNGLQLSQNNGFHYNNDNNLDTTRIESFANSFQNNRQIEEQELLTQKFSHLEKELDEEFKSSAKTLSNSNSLAQIESNIVLSNDSITNNLENYLKELRDENLKLKSTLEKNNLLMKQQLKNLKELQSKTNQTNDEHNRTSEESKTIIQQLRDENSSLKDQVLDLEGMAGLKLVEEMSTELATLRSKCDQLSVYHEIDVNSELQTQNLSAQLIDSKRTIDSMTLEINSLRTQLNGMSCQLESLPAMESQIKIYERDFKIEEMAKLAALKEVDTLEKEIESLKKSKSEMEEKLDKGEPVLELSTEPTGPKSYTCPKCWRRFERFQAIQNHFERCLEDDGLFT